MARSDARTRVGSRMDADNRFHAACVRWSATEARYVLTDPRNGTVGRLAPVNTYQIDLLGIGRTTTALLVWLLESGEQVVRLLNAHQERRLLAACDKRVLKNGWGK